MSLIIPGLIALLVFKPFITPRCLECFYFSLILLQEQTNLSLLFENILQFQYDRVNLHFKSINTL
jgi:hypothetical protein